MVHHVISSGPVIQQLRGDHGMILPKAQVGTKTIRLLKGVGRDSVDKAPGDADREDREDLQAV